jgi:hypothetical protein
MSQPPEKRDDPRQIAKWADRYARSRTIPFLVQWVFIVSLCVILGVLSLVTISAYQANHRTLVWVCIGVIAATTAALIWFAAAKWGGEQIWRITQWVYGKEGYAAYRRGDGAEAMKRAWWLAVVAVGLAVYHLIGAILVGLRYLPMEYMQPLSALGMVPFLSMAVISQRLGFWAWVWPALYGLHAVGLLTGVLPHFTGQWLALDVLVPIFGYGLLSILVGHCYSRYALRKLKQLARAGISEKGQE